MSKAAAVDIKRDPEPSRPDDEYVARLEDELGKIKEIQAALEVVALYEGATVPVDTDGVDRTTSLWRFVYGPGSNAPRGRKLEAQVIAAAKRRVLVEDELERAKGEVREHAAWARRHPEEIPNKPASPAELSQLVGWLQAQVDELEQKLDAVVGQGETA
ncbi:MAG TPA: hypothetical protein VE990_12455 [Acidimicrobiales bacterium]|nr:hypothetical protein [Acidimicrobiales bacterium]